MSILPITTLGRRKPTEDWVIPKDTPLAKGLEFFFDGEMRNITNTRDKAKNRPITRSSSSLIEYKFSPWGKAHYLYWGERATIDTPANLNSGSGEITYMCRVKMQGVSASWVNMFGNYSGSGASGKYVTIFIDASRYVQGATDDGGTQSPIYSTTTMGVGEWWSIVFSVSQAKGTMSLYVWNTADNTVERVDGTPNTGDLTSPDAICMGRDQDSVGWTPYLVFDTAAIWSRYLTPTECWAVLYDPYVVARKSTSYFFVPFGNTPDDIKWLKGNAGTKKTKDVDFLKGEPVRRGNKHYETATGGGVTVLSHHLRMLLTG